MDLPIVTGGGIPAGLDEALLRRVRDRDPKAMEVFFEHFYDRIFGYVASLLRDRHRAEDIAHESFLRLHKSLDRLDPSRDPAPWVFTVVSNLVRDHWRSKEHRVGRDQKEMEEIEQLPAAGGEEQHESLEKKESAMAVRRALTELSEDDREIILLRNYQELGTDEVAKILGIRVDAARQRHSRAVKRLGEAYRRAMGPETD